MTKISKEELLKLAQVSQIRIEENDISDLTKSIEDVLTYASRLQNIQIEDNLEELPHNINTWRDDIVAKTNSQPLLELAPEVEDNYFVVPVIIKTSSNTNNS